MYSALGTEEFPRRDKFRDSQRAQNARRIRQRSFNGSRNDRKATVSENSLTHAHNSTSKHYAIGAVRLNTPTTSDQRTKSLRDAGIYIQHSYIWGRGGWVAGVSRFAQIWAQISNGHNWKRKILDFSRRCEQENLMEQLNS